MLDLINPDDKTITIAELWVDMLIPLKYYLIVSTDSALKGLLRMHWFRLELKKYSESGHIQYRLLKVKLGLQDKHYPFELPMQLEQVE